MHYGTLVQPGRCDELGVCQAKAGLCGSACSKEARARIQTQQPPLKLQPGVLDGPYKQSGRGVAGWLKGLFP